MRRPFNQQYGETYQIDVHGCINPTHPDACRTSVSQGVFQHGTLDDIVLTTWENENPGGRPIDIMVSQFFGDAESEVARARREARGPERFDISGDPPSPSEFEEPSGSGAARFAPELEIPPVNTTDTLYINGELVEV